MDTAIHPVSGAENFVEGLGRSVGPVHVIEAVSNRVLLMSTLVLLLIKNTLSSLMLVIGVLSACGPLFLLMNGFGLALIAVDAAQGFW